MVIVKDRTTGKPVVYTSGGQKYNKDSSGAKIPIGGSSTVKQSVVTVSHSNTAASLPSQPAIISPISAPVAQAQAVNDPSTFKYSFWSLQGQKERLGNVVNTFKSIGSNFLSGKIFKGVEVAPKFQGSVIGKFAGAVSSPATILLAPAAAGAIKVAAPMIIPSLGSSSATKITAAAFKPIKAAGNFLGSSTARKIAGTGVLGYAGIVGSRSFFDTFEKGGVSGFISGTGTTYDEPTKGTTIFETTDQDGRAIRISHEGDQVPGGAFYQLPNGETVPFMQEPGNPGIFGDIFGTPPVSPAIGGVPEILGEGKTDLRNWILPAALVAAGIYIVAKKR